MKDTARAGRDTAGGPAPLLALLFHGVTATALAVVLLPPLLMSRVPDFSGKRLGVWLFCAACVERLAAMYLRPGLGKAIHRAGSDWTAIAVGYAYTLTLGGAVAEFLARQRFPPPPAVAVGAAVYLGGVALRYWAFRILRHQWHVDVSDTEGERHLVRQGPYGLVRHPLYAGACLEIVGLPLALGAWVALAFGVLAFIPLEVARAFYEERFLGALFGPAYADYKRRVGAFVPRLFTRRPDA